MQKSLKKIWFLLTFFISLQCKLKKILIVMEIYEEMLRQDSIEFEEILQQMKEDETKKGIKLNDYGN